MNRQRAVLSILLAGLTVLAFLPSLRNGFVNFDDYYCFGPGSRVQQGITAVGLRWAFTTGHMGNWQPLTWLSHMLDVELFGLEPRGHHATGIALHAANTVLLCLLLQGATGALWRSVAATALFAVHPLRVESVAWAAERKDLLSGFFLLLTGLAYLRSVRQPGCRRDALVAVLFALGLMSKPMLVTLPAVLLVLDGWPLGRLGGGARVGQARAAIVAKLPLLALSTAVAVVTVHLQRGGNAIHSLGLLPIPLRFGNAAVATASYLADLVWPVGLAAFYPLSGNGIAPLRWLGALALLAGISTAAFVLRRRVPCLLAGWLWYLVMLLPVSGIVQVGSQARADRYTYLPMIGVAVSLVWGAGHLLERAPRLAPSTALATGLLIAVLATITSRQIGFWRNGETLYRRIIAVSGPHWIAHSNLGQALFAQGRLEEAQREYERALLLSPRSPELLVELGSVLARRGRVGEALPLFEAAVAADPARSRAHYNYGLALGWFGRRQEALSHLREAARLDPSAPGSMLALGLALSRWGDRGEGARLLAAALRLDPDLERSRLSIERILAGPPR